MTTTAAASASTLSHLDLSKTAAALVAALEPVAGGTSAPYAGVNAAQTSASVAGAGGLSRVVISIGDANGDRAVDLLDMRASNGTLSYHVISGATGLRLWSAEPIVRPSTIYAAAFPAVIQGNDFYLLEQYFDGGKLNWTVRAISGATGGQIWSTSGSMLNGDQAPPTIPPSPPSPSDLPTAIPSTLPSTDCLTGALPEPPAVPGVPEIPPSAPDIPPALPDAPAVPDVAGCLPSELPSVLPSDLPSVLPSEIPSIGCLPSIPPDVTGLPQIPPSIPTDCLPSDLPSVLPSDVPSDLPSDVPSVLPSDVPSDVPSVLPSDVPSDVPSDIPTPACDLSGLPDTIPDPASCVPSITPPGSAPASRSAARSAPHAGPSEPLPTPFFAFATGATPVDMDGNGKADFPLTVYFGINSDTLGTIVEAQLMILNDLGIPVTTVTAFGRGAIPYAGVAGDFTGQNRPGLFVADEINDPAAGAIVTMRAFTGTGSPLFAAVQTFPAGTIGAYDARSDLTGDHMADVLISRFSVAPGVADTIISVRSGPLGVESWRKEYAQVAVATIVGALDATPGNDVLVQGILNVEDGKIPTAITYRGLSGNGTDLYATTMAVPNAGLQGNWSATLVPDAGDLNGDGAKDASHSILVIPSGKPVAWSQSAVNVRTGTSLWTHTTLDTVATPVRDTLNATPASDFVNIVESATKSSDALVIKALGGADGAPIWSTRISVGGGTERVRSVTPLAADLSGTGVSDLVITVVQRSGSSTRTLLAAIRGVGSGGRVLWIRTN